MSLKFNWTLLERRVVSDERNLLSCVIYCQYMKVSTSILPQRCQTRKTSFRIRSMLTYKWNNIQFLVFILIECMMSWKFTNALLFCRINLFYSSKFLTNIILLYVTYFSQNIIAIWNKADNKFFIFFWWNVIKFNYFKAELKYVLHISV